MRLLGGGSALLCEGHWKRPIRQRSIFMHATRPVSSRRRVNHILTKHESTVRRFRVVPSHENNVRCSPCVVLSLLACGKESRQLGKPVRLWYSNLYMRKLFRRALLGVREVVCITLTLTNWRIQNELSRLQDCLCYRMEL